MSTCRFQNFHYPHINHLTGCIALLGIVVQTQNVVRASSYFLLLWAIIINYIYYVIISTTSDSPLTRFLELDVHVHTDRHTYRHTDLCAALQFHEFLINNRYIALSCLNLCGSFSQLIKCFYKFEEISVCMFILQPSIGLMYFHCYMLQKGIISVWETVPEHMPVLWRERKKNRWKELWSANYTKGNLSSILLCAIWWFYLSHFSHDINYLNFTLHQFASIII